MMPGEDWDELISEAREIQNMKFISLKLPKTALCVWFYLAGFFADAISINHDFLFFQQKATHSFPLLQPLTFFWVEYDFPWESQPSSIEEFLQRYCDGADLSEVEALEIRLDSVRHNVDALGQCQGNPMCFKHCWLGGLVTMMGE